MFEPGINRVGLHFVFVLSKLVMLKVKTGKNLAKIPPSSSLKTTKTFKQKGYTYFYFEPDVDHNEIKIFLDYCKFLYG